MSIPQAKMGLPHVLSVVLPNGPADGDVTLTIYRGLDTIFLAEQTVTKDSFTTNLDAEVKKGAQELTVVNTTGLQLEADYYWLSSDGGRGRQVTAVDKTATTITLKDRFSFDITSGSIQSLLYEYTLPTSLTGTEERNLMVVWAWEEKGRRKTHTESLDIVDQPFSLTVSLKEINSVSNEFTDQAGTTQLALTYREQAELEIFRELKGKQLQPDKIYNRSFFHSALIYRVLALRHATHEKRGEYWQKQFRAAMDDFWGSHTQYGDPLTRTRKVGDDILITGEDWDTATPKLNTLLVG